MTKMMPALLFLMACSQEAVSTSTQVDDLCRLDSSGEPICNGLSFDQAEATARALVIKDWPHSTSQRVGCGTDGSLWICEISFNLLGINWVARCQINSSNLNDQDNDCYACAGNVCANGE